MASRTYAITSGAPLVMNEHNFANHALAPIGHFTPIGPVTQDVFQGTSENDDFDGTDVNDSFELGDGGNDHALGRDGDDLFVMGTAFDANDRLSGGGNDSQGDALQLNGDYSAGMTLNANTVQGIELMQLFGTGLGGGSYNLTLNDGNVAAGAVMTIVLQGSGGAPNTMVIDGSAELDGDLVLQSTATGADVLTGGEGNDLVDGGLGGDDSLDGGGGTNRVSFEQLDDGVTVSLASQGEAQDVNRGRMVTLSNFQDLGGSSGDDVLTGDDGDNWIYTAGGNDVMRGKNGDDFLLINNFGEDTAVNADGGGNTDILVFYGNDLGVTFDLTAQGTGQNVDGTLVVTANRIENVGGSFFADHLIGNDSANVLYGDAGDDSLEGGGGDDVLMGDVSYQPILENNAGRSGFDEVVAGNFKDNLDGGKGDDALYGGSGKDKLTGGSDLDELTGGGSSDTFVFKAVDDSGVGSGHRDLVMDFHPGSDKLDVSKIDADSDLGGDQAFHLVGGYTHHAGEIIQFHNASGDTIVGADVNGDGASDFQIQLLGDLTLASTDFIL